MALMRDDIEPLIMDHWNDSGIFDDVVPDIDWDTYLIIEERGMFKTFSARHNGNLVGYQGYTIMPHHHYKKMMVASQTVIFILKEYRKGFVGSKFIDFAEILLSKSGVDMILQHTKDRKDLSVLFKRKGYEIMDHVYIKRL